MDNTSEKKGFPRYDIRVSSRDNYNLTENHFERLLASATKIMHTHTFR
jgi:hypothetical protein